MSDWHKNHYKEKKAWLNQVKNVPCMDCGNCYPPECMDFDHRDPSGKRFTIAQNLTRRLSDVLEEIAKCDIVCANCHRIRTHQDKQ
jgi:hypothetical protein